MHFYEKDREKIVKASLAEEVEENEMDVMPINDIERQLLILYDIEEKIRNKKEYNSNEQNEYFLKLTKELEKYSNK